MYCLFIIMMLTWEMNDKRVKIITLYLDYLNIDTGRMKIRLSRRIERKSSNITQIRRLQLVAPTTIPSSSAFKKLQRFSWILRSEGSSILWTKAPM